MTLLDKGKQSLEARSQKLMCLRKRHLNKHLESEEL